MKLAEAKVMQGLDQATINLGVPGIVLMENAGKGTVDLIRQQFGELAGRSVAIVAGPGNNGGDGFVIARHLLQLKAKPVVFSLVSPGNLKGDALANYKILENLNIEIFLIKEDNDLEKAQKIWGHSFLLVDAIFGTGLKRDVEGIFAKTIETMNRLGRPIISVDIPSGLDSDSGKPLGVCVNAVFTATYGLAKPGQVTYPGVQYTGLLKIVDIGIPQRVVDEAEITIDLLQKKEMAKLLPKREQESHKGSFGHLLVLGGAQGKTGAAILAARAAMRAGSGLVSVAVPQKLNDIFEKSLIEAMTIPLASDYFFGEQDIHAIENALSGKSAIVVGPGIGTDSDTCGLISKLYETVKVPMVVDADGLNILAKEKKTLNNSIVRILTPHPGEMSRLAGVSTSAVQNDRLNTARSFAEENNVIVVLKGAATVIAAPDGRIAINPTGNPAMASGGTGDVLSGVIGSLVSQGMDPWNACCLGVYVHGLSADRIAAAHDLSFGIIATEIADEIPLAMNEITKGE